MQARKLIRLLNEMINKNPSLAYAKVCVDSRYIKSFEYTFVEANDCEVKTAEGWNDNHEIQKTIIVIGNY